MYSQDAYHTNLNEFLQTEYNLPAADWLIGDTETYVLGSVQSYGVSKTTEDETGQDFSKYSRVVVSSPGDNPWDRGWKINNPVTINAEKNYYLLFG